MLLKLMQCEQISSRQSIQSVPQLTHSESIHQFWFWTFSLDKMTELFDKNDVKMKDNLVILTHSPILISQVQQLMK